MTRTVDFHRLEEYALPEHGFNTFEEVVVSFETKQHGIFQINCDGSSLDQFSHEPDLNMFKQVDQDYIEAVAHLVWRMVFDAPAKKKRFETKDLYTDSAN